MPPPPSPRAPRRAIRTAAGTWLWAASALATAACGTPAARPVTVAGPGPALPATVVHVVDGDTLDVEVAGGSRERVRLLGVDTPETVKPNTPVQCFGPEASRHTKDLLPPGTGVLLQRDEEPRDRYGRLLAYLWRARDHRFVNRDLVAEGFARTLSIEPNTAYRATLSADQDAARRARAGLWGACAPGPSG
jgi:micrococcal nuclease